MDAETTPLRAQGSQQPEENAEVSVHSLHYSAWPHGSSLRVAGGQALCLAWTRGAQVLQPLSSGENTAGLCNDCLVTCALARAD